MKRCTILLTLGFILGYSNGLQISVPHDADDHVLRTYRRCMYETTKYLPRRLVLLSLCSNLFCENHGTRKSSFFVVEKVPRENDCIDYLTDQCVQGDEEELRYRPYPECCPIFCELKKRLNRLKYLINRRRWVYGLQGQSSEEDKNYTKTHGKNTRSNLRRQNIDRRFNAENRDYLSENQHYSNNPYTLNDNRYMNSDSRYITGDNRYITGDNRYITGDNRYNTNEGRYITSETRYGINDNRNIMNDNRRTSDNQYIPSNYQNYMINDRNYNY